MRQRELRLNWFRHPRSGWSRLAYIDPKLGDKQQGIVAVWPDSPGSYRFIGQATSPRRWPSCNAAPVPTRTCWSHGHRCSPALTGTERCGTW